MSNKRNCDEFVARQYQIAIATFAVLLVILTTVDGLDHLPDNTLLLSVITSTNDVKWLATELRKFTHFHIHLCPKHRIHPLAFTFDKTKSDNPHFAKANGLSLAQQEPDIACIRLY